MFEVCVFHRLKGYFGELIENNRKVPLRKIPRTFGIIPMKTGEYLFIIIIIMYLYSAQYLHILQDSKRYLSNPTVQVQPKLISN